jgi:hypothetical protein
VRRTAYARAHPEPAKRTGAGHRDGAATVDFVDLRSDIRENGLQQKLNMPRGGARTVLSISFVLIFSIARGTRAGGRISSRRVDMADGTHQARAMESWRRHTQTSHIPQTYLKIDIAPRGSDLGVHGFTCT